MTKTVDQIIQEARTLTAEERARVAEELLRSLDDPEQAETDAAWAEEIERRIDELDAGRMPTRAADEVMREMRDRLRNRR